MVSALASQISATPKDNQTIPLSKPMPSPNITMRNTTTSTAPLSGFVPNSQADQFDMTIQLTPYTQSQTLRDEGWYEVLGWQLALTDQSSLCPTQNCAFQLEGGRMGGESIPGERFLSAKLRINSGMTTQIKHLGILWSAVEERIEAGQRAQAVEGSLSLGNRQNEPNTRYQIEGTLAPYGQDLILSIHGVKE
jgi:hypothetical protein